MKYKPKKFSLSKMNVTIKKPSLHSRMIELSHIWCKVHLELKKNWIVRALLTIHPPSQYTCSPDLNC